MVVDPAANGKLAGDGLVSPAHSGVGVAVVEAREDLEIARQMRRLLA